MASFPNNVWNGESSHRNTPYINRKPDYVDWNRIVDELIATQQYIKYLETLISQGSGTPLALGGSLGQVQFNNGSTLGGLRGNVLTNDVNGPTDAVAIGDGSWALGEQSLAVGNGCIASTDQSIALGYGCVAGVQPLSCTISSDSLTVTLPGNDYTTQFHDNDDGALVLSQLSGGTGPTIVYCSIDDGGVVFDGTDTVLTLKSAITTHTSGFANMRNDYTVIYAEGNTSAAYGSSSHAEGYGTIVFGLFSHVEGFNSTSYGDFSHAEGSFTSALGSYSHTEGSNTNASGYYSHAEGYFTVASGTYSHAEGHFTNASAAYSYAGGDNAIASLPCQWSRSDGTSVPGQISLLIASCKTVNTSPVLLLIESISRLSISWNHSFGFLISIVGTKTDLSVSAFFIRQGIIVNNNGTMSISSINTVGTDINPSNWSIDIIIDDINHSLSISVTGEDTVNWKGRIEFVEVGI